MTLISANVFRLGNVTEANNFYLHFQILHLFEQYVYFCLHCIYLFFFFLHNFLNIPYGELFFMTKPSSKCFNSTSSKCDDEQMYKLVEPKI